MTQHDLASDGLVTCPSAYGMAETVTRLKAFLAEKALHLFAHIDHAAAAQEIGLSLRPTQVLIFGNPRAGTPLMQSTQAIGLDLPLRVLIWEDEGGTVWLTYTEPHYLARRYRIADREQEVTAIGVGLAALTRAAAAR